MCSTLARRHITRRRRTSRTKCPTRSTQWNTSIKKMPFVGRQKAFFVGALKSLEFSRCGARSGAALNVHRTFIHFRAPVLVPFIQRKNRTSFGIRFFGALKGTRTPGLLLRRQLLYPAELSAQLYGAGDGSRTHTTSLEGWDSTAELHPRQRNIYYH